MKSTRQQVTGWVVVKSVNTAERRIGGYFSTRYTDREGEEFAPEAFAASIAPGGTYYANPVLLYNHDAGRLVGRADVATLGYDEVGAYGEFLVSEEATWGQIERGELRGFSWFGYIDPTQSQLRSEGGQQIPVHYAVDLVEVTVTPIPCNPGALFEVRSKSLEVERRKGLRAVQKAATGLDAQAEALLADPRLWRAVEKALDRRAVGLEARRQKIKHAGAGASTEVGALLRDVLRGGR